MERTDGWWGARGRGQMHEGNKNTQREKVEAETEANKRRGRRIKAVKHEEVVTEEGRKKGRKK